MRAAVFAEKVAFFKVEAAGYRVRANRNAGGVYSQRVAAAKLNCMAPYQRTDFVV